MPIIVAQYDDCVDDTECGPAPLSASCQGFTPNNQNGDGYIAPSIQVVIKVTSLVVTVEILEPVIITE